MLVQVLDSRKEVGVKRQAVELPQVRECARSELYAEIASDVAIAMFRKLQDRP